MSPHLKGRGQIVFDADYVGVGVGLGIKLSCLHSICEPVAGFLPNFHGEIIET